MHSHESIEAVDERLAVLRMRRSERGASLVEYALLVALIAMVCVAAVTLFGGETSQKFSEVSSEINAT